MDTFYNKVDILDFFNFSNSEFGRNLLVPLSRCNCHSAASDKDSPIFAKFNTLKHTVKMGSLLLNMIHKAYEKRYASKCCACFSKIKHVMAIFINQGKTKVFFLMNVKYQYLVLRYKHYRLQSIRTFKGKEKTGFCHTWAQLDMKSCLS